MANRQTKFTAYTGVYVLLFLAGLSVINFLAQRHNKSVDTTSNKRFSLSDQTEKVVKNLATDVKVTYVDRTDRFNAGRDLLDRYSNLSNKLNVVYLDPYKNPQGAKAIGARTEGSIFVESSGRKEEARTVSEEEITGAIIRTMKTGDRTVCAIEGNGERALDSQQEGNGAAVVKQSLERFNYKTKVIHLYEKAEIPADCTILLSIGPRRDYSEQAVAAIKAFVEKGGRAAFLLAPPLKGAREDSDENAKLNEVLASWGIQVNNDLLFDDQGNGVVVADKYESHPIVREMSGLPAVLPLARTLDLKAGGKGTAEKLFSSSEGSFATKQLDVTKLQESPSKDKTGSQPVAAAVSFDAGSAGDRKLQARVAVVGSADWATNSFLSRYGNRDLFLNIMNWLSNDEDLISIRPKDPEDRRLDVKPGQVWTVYFTSFFPVIAVLAAGVMVWLKRR